MMRSFWVLLACFLVTGCGNYGSVKGTVSYKGETLKTGKVTAVSSNGNFTSNIDEEGKYEIKGLAAGKIKFYVSVPNPKTKEVAEVLLKKSKDPSATTAGRGPQAIKKSDLTKEQLEAMTKHELIPQKYSDTTKDILTFELKTGENNFDIALTD